MESRIGRFSSRALPKAASPHSYHATGFGVLQQVGAAGKDQAVETLAAVGRERALSSALSRAMYAAMSALHVSWETFLSRPGAGIPM